MPMRRWVLIVAAVLVAGPALRAEDAAKAPGKLPFAVSKETTGIAAPVLEDGTPDYVRAINEKYGKSVKPQDNAYAAWLKVVGTKETVPEKVRTKFLEMCGVSETDGMKWVPYWEWLRNGGMEYNTIGDYVGQEIRATGQLWDDTDFPKLAEFLAARKDFFDASVEALGHGKYWVPVVAQDGRSLNSVTSPSASLPGVDKFRTTLASIAQRATMKMKGGDFDGFLADVKLLERTGREMQKAGTLRERLAGLTTHGVMSRAIGAAAGSGKLTQGQCLALWEMMNAMGEHGTINETIDVERRWLILERAVLVATGNVELLKRGRGYDSYNHMMDSIEVAAVDWNAALGQINREIDETMANLKKWSARELLAKEKETENSWTTFFGGDGDCSKKEGETRDVYTARIAHNFVLTMGISLERCELTRRESKLQRDMARTAIALAAFRVDHNKWPEKLSELAPVFLKEIPNDIYSAGEKAEILYARADNGVRVYSVGTNGDDDGGVKDDPYHPGAGHDDIVVGAGVSPK